jgi:SAM-dependent methyltransferase
MHTELPFPPIEMRMLAGPIDLLSFDNPTRQRIFPDIPAENYETVFDFGCGCGRIARQLIQQTVRPRKYVGIDIHHGMIKWCQKNLCPYTEDFDFIHHDVGNIGLNPGKHKSAMLPFPAGDDSFKLVIAYSVFTHLLEEQAVYYLGETSRILHPSGILMSTWFLFDKRYFPMMQDFQNALYINHVDPINAVIFDFSWLRETARDKGLKIINVIPPIIRGFQWFVYMAPLQSEHTEANFSDDTAPFGFWRSPFLEHAASTIVENELQQGHNSYGWKALKFYYQLRNRIFPPESKQRKLVKLILKVIRVTFKKKLPFSHSVWLNLHTAILPTICEYKRDRKFLRKHGNKELSPFPPPYLRFRVTGSYSLEHFHNTGLASRHAFANALKKVGKSFEDFNSILDFGCGCGRIMRWMKDVSQYSQLHGIDTDKPAVRWCQNQLKFAHFSINNPLPPTEFQNNKFDLIFSNSVLTHLDNNYQDQWLEELNRIAKPGAYILVTVNGEHAWKQFYDTAPSNPAMKNYRDAFLRDGYLYVSNDNWSGIFPDFYHSMFHSYEYVHQHWTKFLDIKAYLPKEMLEYQDIVVMQKTE